MARCEPTGEAVAEGVAVVRQADHLGLDVSSLKLWTMASRVATAEEPQTWAS